MESVIQMLGSILLAVISFLGCTKRQMRLHSKVILRDVGSILQMGRPRRLKSARRRYFLSESSLWMLERVWLVRFFM